MAMLSSMRVGCLRMTVSCNDSCVGDTRAEEDVVDDCDDIIDSVSDATDMLSHVW